MTLWCLALFADRLTVGMMRHSTGQLLAYHQGACICWQPQIQAEYCKCDIVQVQRMCWSTDTQLCSETSGLNTVCHIVGEMTNLP